MLAARHDDNDEIAIHSSWENRPMPSFPKCINAMSNANCLVNNLKFSSPSTFTTLINVTP